jgi:hypothetical protein
MEEKPANEATSRTPNRLRPLLTIIVGLVLIIPNTLWVMRAERVGSGPYFSTISIFANVLFILTALLIFNQLLKKLVPKLAFSQAELMLIYAMVSIGGAMAGQDFGSALIPMLSHPTQFGNASNGWLERFGQYLPEALTVSDKEALKGFYQGHSSVWQPAHIAAWSGPILLWSGFIAVLFWTMMCLAVLMRRGWQDRERLPFPIVEMPLQMTDPAATLWKNKLFWVGFGVCAAIEVLNGIASLYPSLPSINLQHVSVENQGIFSTSPWNAAGFTCYSFYPFAIGLGYLLPLDLLFSCWFFYLFWKAQLIISRFMAWDTVPDFPFVREQAFGGYIAILVFMVWNGRNYFKEMGKRIFKEPSDLDDSSEALTYTQATLGASIGFIALVCFTWWAGLSPMVGAAAFAIYFALALAVSRIRAELGPPVHDLHFSGPDHMLTRAFGTTAFTARDLTVLNFFYWFNRAYRSHPAPFATETLKSAKDVGASQKTYFWGTVIAGAFAGFVTLWGYLYLAYDFGASGKMRGGTGFAGEAYNRLNGWMVTPQAPNGIANGAMGVGFVFCALLMIARTRLAWFPLHPIGYAISGSWSMNLVWMPLLFAWILKGLILRYGGVKLYRQLMPIFLGMILGQCLTGPLWHLIGWYLDVQPYSFWGG